MYVRGYVPIYLCRYVGMYVSTYWRILQQEYDFFHLLKSNGQEDTKWEKGKSKYSVLKDKS